MKFQTEVVMSSHSGYFYLLLHFFKWLQTYLVDPILWIFTGFTTLKGPMDGSFWKAFIESNSEKLPPDISVVQKSQLDETRLEKSAQIVDVWFRAAYCYKFGQNNLVYFSEAA